MTKLILVKILCISLFLALTLDSQAHGEAQRPLQTREELRRARELIHRANQNGPLIGVIVPNLLEMNYLLNHPSFHVTDVIDYAGRRFTLGTIGDTGVVMVMSGLAMLNTGLATYILLDQFYVQGVVHYGIAGNANPYRHIGDVTIPHRWIHSGLWSWQRYGLGPENSLPLEIAGDYTRKYGSIRFADYAADKTGDNLLNRVWYQPEEVFPVDGTPEEREHVFELQVDTDYYKLANKLKDLKLEGCINSTTCLEHAPIVKRVRVGTSSNIYLDNAAYRGFLYHKFNVTTVDMDSAAVALVCYQLKVPFIAFKGLSDLAGGGEAQSNEADDFISLAASNTVKVVVQFIKLLSPAKAGRSAV